jgi:hypothetical protein
LRLRVARELRGGSFSRDRSAWGDHRSSSRSCGWPVSAAISSKALSRWSTVRSASSGRGCDQQMGDRQCPVLPALGECRLHRDGPMINERREMFGRRRFSGVRHTIVRFAEAREIGRFGTQLMTNQ